jgi:cell division inhibitor SepF
MEPITLASSGIEKTIEVANKNARRSNMPLAFAITSTVFLLIIAIFSQDYLSRTNREFGVKICLFLTGVSTAFSIKLLDKKTNALYLHPESHQENLSALGKSYQINIENFSGNLVDGGVPNELIYNISEPSSGENFEPVASLNDRPNEVSVLEPRSFEEIPAALVSLQEGKSVVLNLTILDPDIAQRAVDFVAGGAYSMNANQARIAESIFLFTPSGSRVLEQEKPVSSDSRPKLRLLNFEQTDSVSVPELGREQSMSRTGD